MTPEYEAGSGDRYDGRLKFNLLMAVLSVLLVLAGIRPDRAGAEAVIAASGGLSKVAVGEYFSCAVPRDWGEARYSGGLSPEEKGVYGVTLDGPWRGETPVRISVIYYAEGNLLYKSADHYIRLFSEPALGVTLEGNSYGQVTSAIVSGKSAKVFERIKTEFVTVHSRLDALDGSGGRDPRVYERREMMARPVPVRERFVVVPAKSGFYALRYSAPAEHFQVFQDGFEKVVFSLMIK